MNTDLQYATAASAAAASAGDWEEVRQWNAFYKARLPLEEEQTRRMRASKHDYLQLEEDIAARRRQLEEYDSCVQALDDSIKSRIVELQLEEAALQQRIASLRLQLGNKPNAAVDAGVLPQDLPGSNHLKETSQEAPHADGLV